MPARSVLLLLTVTACLATTGCGDPPEVSSARTKAKSVTPTTLLDSALELLKDSETNPESYRLAAQRLNQFLDTQSSSEVEDIPPEFLKVIKLEEELRLSITILMEM